MSLNLDFEMTSFQSQSHYQEDLTEQQQSDHDQHPHYQSVLTDMQHNIGHHSAQFDHHSQLAQHQLNTLHSSPSGSGLEVMEHENLPSCVYASTSGSRRRGNNMGLPSEIPTSSTSNPHNYGNQTGKTISTNFLRN
jgi:hypothetical protein